MPDPKDLPHPDPRQLQESLAQIAERSAQVVAKYVESQPQLDMLQNIRDLGIDKAFSELGARLLADPVHLARRQMSAWEDQIRLWTATLQKAQGAQVAAVKAPSRGDNRFRNELWENNFIFDYIKQSYLIAAEHIQRTVSETQGLAPGTARKVSFFTRQYVDALAPTNFAVTNPDVLKATAESGGRNLLQGLNNLLKDLDRGRGKLAIRMTDYDAFTLGENVATTPGKVVFQNDLMQLLQYSPTTPQADRTPLLICPPWINKYYILDLRAKNSFIKWAVDRGLTVFVISWVNPDGRHAHKTFDDYLFEGPLAAMDAVQKATGEAAVNLIGYCLGGTLTACLMSWLRSRGQSARVKSVTYFTTMIDFSEPGELGVFVDEPTVDNLERRMASRGYLEGEEMAGTFNMLRDNDLIWSFVVNNYLLGKEPFPFDLLYWNSDATRMPARMHTFYLRNMYIHNLLARPGALTVGGEAMDLGEVTTPTYFISAMEDHIAPWKSTYAGAGLLSGPVRFVLGGSGHIAGIVNPPAAGKYCYWTNPQLPAAPDAWMEGAIRHEGSWWEDWGTWISGFSGGRVPARIPGDGSLPALENAPGSYAKFRLDAPASTAPEGRPPETGASGAAAPAPVPPSASPAGAEGTPPRPATPRRSAKASAPAEPAPRRPRGKPAAPAAATPEPRKPAGTAKAAPKPSLKNASAPAQTGKARTPAKSAPAAISASAAKPPKPKAAGRAGKGTERPAAPAPAIGAKGKAKEPARQAAPTTPAARTVQSRQTGKSAPTTGMADTIRALFQAQGRTPKTASPAPAAPSTTASGTGRGKGGKPKRK
ncbi:MAG: class I poly(R)-hydroxyalkanoic acid synthase [Betaproteobacteria bacterium]